MCFWVEPITGATPTRPPRSSVPLIPRASAVRPSGAPSLVKHSLNRTPLALRSCEHALTEPNSRFLTHFGPNAAVWFRSEPHVAVIAHASVSTQTKKLASIGNSFVQTNSDSFEFSSFMFNIT